MKFVPLYDRVLVKRVDEVNKTSGGIIIPDTAKEKPSEGIVEAVGNGGRGEDGKLIPMSVKGRRPDSVCQMVGHRSQTERRRPADHQGIGNFRRN